MHRSDPLLRRGPVDWRGWIVVAWVLWFGLLYGKMVVEQRAHRFRELVRSGPGSDPVVPLISARPAPASR